MTSPGDGPDPHDAPRVDPAYEALFRQDDEAPASVSAHATPPAPPAPEPGAEAAPETAAELAPETAAEPEPETAAEPEPSPAPEPGVDTGRLFRSQGVEGHTETVLALETGRFTRLKTLERTSVEPPAAPDTGADPQVAALIGSTGASMSGTEPRKGRTKQPRSTGTRAARGITGVAVAIVVIGVTVLVGLANALLGDGVLGWPTGLALLVSSVYAALTVRRASDTIAFLMPPVAFLIATLTVGQAFLGALKTSLIGRAEVAFSTLGSNWIWIIGSTLAALIIVLVRRRRS